MRDTLSVILLAYLGSQAVFAQQVPLNQVPSRIIGHPLPEQTNVNSSSPNLVEGREFASPQGIALDTDVNPPYIYVSDTGNHRILGWRSSTSFRNGQPADLVIRPEGQNFYRTNPGGPSVSGAPSTGMNSPTGLTVYKGDLYVADSGNHRILRFRKPFNNIGNQFPDLHIGQVNFSTARANYTGQVDRQGLSLGAHTANLAFDANGNLWVTDVGNRRVLQFLAADVAAGPGPLAASVEIGQLNFTSTQAAVTNATRTKADAFATPSGIAFDSAGRLYVTDTAFSGDNPTVSRVLVFTPPFSPGMSAARIMGVFPGSAPNQDAADRTWMFGIEGLFFMPGISKMGVVDSASNRILLFDTFDKWPDQAAVFSPLANGVVGQPDYRNRGRNRSSGTHLAIATAESLFGPTAVAFTGTELFVVDSANHRIVVLPFSNGNFGQATRVLGQDTFNGQAPNLIEGREFFFANGETGIAIDTSSDTPHLYVADSGNNRILGFRDVRKLQAGVKADVVIGQADFTTSVCNFQGVNSPDSGNIDRPTQSSLCNPTGVVVDSAGNLYVADTGNGRVVRFPAPFAHQGQLPQADLVIGQRSFTSKITDPTPSTMAAPFGLSFVTDNGLLVSDPVHNRVLYFPFPGGGTFPAGDTGRAASKVFGQPDFFTAARTNTPNGMNSPRHVGSDSEGRPYVSDTGNNRILIFDQINTVGTAGAPAAKILTGFSQPRGLFVNQSTGEAWVGDSTTVVEKYPKFETLLINPAAVGNVGSFLGLAITQDNFGNLAVADITHRVAFYYRGVQGINGANFIPSRQLAPGVIASLCSPSSNCDPARTVPLFGTTTADHNSVPNPIPLPKSIADVQVLFNGEPAPLYFVSPSQINFIVPWSAPSSGTAEVQVVQTSTGRIFGAGTVAMDTYSPAILMQQYSGPLRQGGVLNQDSTVNSPTNPAERGTYVQIFAIGQGLVPNAPPDGAPPQTLTPTPFGPRAVIGTCFVELCPKDVGEAVPSQGYIAFSGLSPQFPGVWQINVYIPKTTGPGNQIPIGIVAGSKGNVEPNSGFQVTIAIK